MCPSIRCPKPGKLAPDTSSQDTGEWAALGWGQEGCLGTLDALSLDLGAAYTDVCTLG